MRLIRYNEYQSEGKIVTAEEMKSQLQDFCEENLANILDNINGKVRCSVTAAMVTISLDGFDMGYEVVQDFINFFELVKDNYNLRGCIRLIGAYRGVKKYYNGDFYPNNFVELTRDFCSRIIINTLVISLDENRYTIIRQGEHKGEYNYSNYIK